MLGDLAERGRDLQRVTKTSTSTLKADIWAHFGFYELTGKHELDKTHAVCKICLPN